MCQGRYISCLCSQTHVANATGLLTLLDLEDVRSSGSDAPAAPSMMSAVRQTLGRQGHAAPSFAEEGQAICILMHP